MQDLKAQINNLPPEKLALLSELLKSRASTEPAAPALNRRRKLDHYPLSFAQQRLWFLDKLEPGSALYNCPMAVRLAGRLDISALNRTLSEIVRRHEVLRTTFAEADEQPVQVISPARAVIIPIVDLTGIDKQRREAEAARVAAEEARHPFDLDRGPLFRAGLIRLEEQEQVVLFTMHHIVSDGWSMWVLTREVATLYSAIANGKASPLPELTTQYADYALWQREWLTDEVLREQLDYWKKHLEGLRPVLELTTDRPRPIAQTYRGASEPIVIPQELSESIKALCRRENVTLFIAMLAVFQLLLERYTRQPDIVVGTPIAGRNRLETEALIGFFVNALVLRTDLSGDPSFKELLARVSNVVLEAHAHQDLPFERIVEELQPSRSMSHAPLFQVVFSLQNVQQQSLQLPGMNLRVLNNGNQMAKYELQLDLTESAGKIVGSMEYNADLFDAETIRRMLSHYVRLLEGAVSDPTLRLSALPMWTEGELHKVLVEWNNAEIEYSKGSCIHQLFERQVEINPARTALVYEERRLSYGELNRKANQLAHYLRLAGVEAEARVGICAERSLEMVVAVLGVLKAGAAYVPLDPAYPQSRLQVMIEDSGMEVLLTNQHLIEQLPDHRARVIAIDSQWDEISRHSDHCPDVPLNADNPAYVIYTSGSTGKPKGVLVTHHNVVRLFQATQDLFNFNGDDVWTLFHSFAFDFSVWELWGALIYGGRLVIAPYWVSRSSDAFYDLLKQESVTVLNQTPSAFKQLISAEESRPEPQDLKLRYVIFGGEALELQSLKGWFDRHGDQQPQLINMYGITETTVHVTHRRITRADVEQGRGSLIGRPIRDLQLYILDERQQPVGIGTPGEICVGGGGLARGYLNHPEMTAARFIANPLGEREGTRLYRSGDLARYLPDGELEYLGRADEQVKVRGYRIELGEIEEALIDHPIIAQATVIARKEPGGERRLVAYAVTKGGADFKAGDLQKYLKQRLPDYMVPAIYVKISEIPLSVNGKVDRRALPDPEAQRDVQDEEFVEARNGVEEKLVAIWKEVLGLERVGVRNNFFELGGDSILSLQIVARAKQDGILLTPRQVFEHQVIEELAEIVTSAGAKESGPESIQPEAKLTPPQRLFFEQEADDANSFSQSALLEIKGAFDSERMQKAAGRLALFHDALTLRFKREGDSWTPFYADADSAMRYVRFDLSSEDYDQQWLCLDREAEALRASLNVSEGPLFIIGEFNLGCDRGVRLLMIAHHLVIDEQSWAILLDDLERAYLRGEEIISGQKTISYKAWSTEAVAHFNSPQASGQAGYWRGETEKKVRPIIAIDSSSSPRCELIQELTEEQTRELHLASNKYNTALVDLLLAALAKAFEKWRGDRRVRLMVRTDGRAALKQVNASRTVGSFAALCPVVLEMDEGAEEAEVIKSVKERLRSIPDSGLGYGVFKHTIGTGADGEIKFSYTGDAEQLIAESALWQPAPERGELIRYESLPRCALEVEATILRKRLRLKWNYSEAAKTGISMLASHYADELQALIAHCRAGESRGYTPSDFPLARMNQQKLDALAASYPGIEDIYPLSPMQHGMFFHSLYAPESGAYFSQSIYNLPRDLNVSALKSAWQKVIDRHPVLRTCFVWGGLPDPLQVVLSEVAVPWTEHDWRGLAPSEAEKRFQEFLEEDEKRGFNFSEAPLMRLSLLRANDESYQFVWSTHHMLLDGWSMPLIFGEVLGFFNSICEGRQIEPDLPRPYRNYISWLQEQDTSKAEAYWEQMLKGFTPPPPLGDGKKPRRREVPDKGYDQLHILLEEDESAALQSFSRRHRLTINTIVQGAWAILLSHHGGSKDVVFGTTVSGRPADLQGVEKMIGLFINTLPVRVRFSPEDKLLPWLKGIQESQLEMRQYEYSSLVMIQRGSQVARGQQLFESNVVFFNLPTNRDVVAAEKRVANGGGRSKTPTSFPLTLKALPGRRVFLELLFDRSRFDATTISEFLNHLRAVLLNMINKPEATVSSFEEIYNESLSRQKMAGKNKRKESEFSRFLNVKPQSVALSENGLIKTNHLAPGQTLPLVIEPVMEGLDLISWIKNNRSFIETNLTKYGGLLFRNFDIESVDRFDEFARAICPELLDYFDQHTPRTRWGGKIYTSTEYPADHHVPFHSENSKNPSWPMKIWFFCHTPAERGGETPIADNRKVFQLIDPKIRERFIEKNVMYVRNFGDGLGLSWQTAFQSSSKPEVEEYCRRANIAFEWKTDNHLKVTHVCQAVAKHPQTSDMLWFNQAHLFHYSSLSPDVRESLLTLYKEEEFPSNAYYGDGTRIESSILDEIRSAYSEVCVSFPWKKSDILLLDNMLVAHSRAPFAGTRKVYVAMSELFSC